MIGMDMYGVLRAVLVRKNTVWWRGVRAVRALRRLSLRCRDEGLFRAGVRDLTSPGRMLRWREWPCRRSTASKKDKRTLSPVETPSLLEWAFFCLLFRNADSRRVGFLGKRGIPRIPFPQRGFVKFPCPSVMSPAGRRLNAGLELLCGLRFLRGSSLRFARVV
jgi:hypothetical protein